MSDNEVEFSSAKALATCIAFNPPIKYPKQIDSDIKIAIFIRAIKDELRGTVLP